MSLKVSECLVKPELDPDFIPAVKWNHAYRSLTNACDDRSFFEMALRRSDGTTSVFKTMVLPHTEMYAELNIKYIERILKFLLWMKGGYKIFLEGDEKLCREVAAIYSSSGKRAFDNDFIAEKVYGRPMEFVINEGIPESFESSSSLGRNLDGCRIGFDLGGSDRKCAALIDGRVVYSEEITWDPYFEKDPNYHLNGIRDSINRAIAHLPKVDCIGGSAAGVYVNNEVRAASLFRGVSEKDFESSVRNIFFELKEEFNNVPFEVVNDGEVTALAGSMSMDSNAVLGISMGTSLAAGYVTANGYITSWLNELAFVPVDYNDEAPADEWSGDIGCGVQYFSQQCVARLIAKAGIDEISSSLPFP
ncbi:MAG: ROK family protein, partial [Lentisphaeraceae bacterium]|nr:ROK family protein [Lentisphaeraceae bacterium]